MLGRRAPSKPSFSVTRSQSRYASNFVKPNVREAFDTEGWSFEPITPIERETNTSFRILHEYHIRVAAQPIVYTPERKKSIAMQMKQRYEKAGIWKNVSEEELQRMQDQFPEKEDPDEKVIAELFGEDWKRKLDVLTRFPPGNSHQRRFLETLDEKQFEKNQLKRGIDHIKKLSNL